VHLIEPRSVHLGLLASAAKEPKPPPHSSSARPPGRAANHQQIAMAFAAAAQLMLAGGHSERAKALLEELERSSGTRGDPYYAALLPELVRCALALGDLELAARLIAGVEAANPACNSTRSARAAARSRKLVATTPTAVTALRRRGHAVAPVWRRAGGRLRRCSARDAAWSPSAGPQLTPRCAEARELFAAMGYAPAVNEDQRHCCGGRRRRPHSYS